MRPSPDVLPRSLRQIAADTGLIYLTHSGGQICQPVACKALPIDWQDPVEVAYQLPLQQNFSREVLDMDREDDRTEYNKIMTYCHAGYGGHLYHLDRQFVRKIRHIDGKKKTKKVQRIFVEYFAPYRVMTHAPQQIEPSLRQAHPPPQDASDQFTGFG